MQPHEIQMDISVLNAPENNSICTEVRVLNMNKIYYLTNSF